jgi:homeobox protein cut-like
MSSLEQNFSGALATWRGKLILSPAQSLTKSLVNTGINLTELQKTLDAQGIELVDNQKESVLGRKGLADKTKGWYFLCVIIVINHTCPTEFKKLSEGDKPVAFKGLLKGKFYTSTNTP